MYSCYIELGDIHILQAALVFVFLFFKIYILTVR